MIQVTCHNVWGEFFGGTMVSIPSM